MANSTTAQWALDRTASGLFAVSRGFLEAATTDNVQALALLACEGFGATIAMSPESCHKAYLLCSQGGQSAILAFVKAQIGYRKGDSGWHLAQSDAGLRFLGLAAALSTIDAWTASCILYTLIRQSAADKKLVPTAPQLKQLVIALESRLAKCGFANNVLGWSQVFMNEMETSGDVMQSASEKQGIVTPCAETIAALVEETAAIARLGEEAWRVEIHTTADQAAWIVAFVKWCLGAPPLIVLHGGHALGQQSGSSPLVTLRLLKSTGKSQRTRVETYDTVGELKRLVTAIPPLSGLRGLVSVGVYGEAVLRHRFGTKSDVKHRACVGALPYACALVRDKLLVTKISASSGDIPPDVDEYLGSGATARRGQVFPSVTKISQTLNDYLRSADEPTLLLPELTALQGALIGDLPLWAMLQQRMAEDCPCRLCKNTAARNTCTYGTLMNDFSTTVANILLLSLLRPLDPDGVQVFFGCDVSGNFIAAVKLILFGEAARARSRPLAADCTVWDILQPAVAMLGHEFGDSRAWVMSSCYGQTVFPCLLATMVLEPEGVLSLECVPGAILQGSKPYALAQVSPDVLFLDFSDEESDDGIMREGRLPQAKLPNPIRAQNSYNDATEWMVKPRESDISIAVVAPQLPTHPLRNPMYAVESAAESVFVYCNHDRMAPCSVTNLTPFETTPSDPRPPGNKQSIGIVQCDRNEPMRFFSLAAGRPAVVRMDACLECCVKCCVLTGRSSVIC